MALSRLPNPNIEDFSQALSTMNSAKILCFACSCTERLRPAIKHFWVEEDCNTILSIIDMGWDLSIHGSLPTSQLHYIDILQMSIDKARQLNGENVILLPLLKDALASVFYMLHYTLSVDVTFASLCAQRVHNSADWLACELFGFGKRLRVDKKVLLSSAPVRLELQKQWRDLKLLQVTPLDTYLMQQIRADAQVVGGQLMRFLQEYLKQRGIDFETRGDLYL